MAKGPQFRIPSVAWITGAVLIIAGAILLLLFGSPE